MKTRWNVDTRGATKTRMNIENQSDIFSNEDVDKVIELGDALAHVEGLVIGDKVDHKIRDAKIAWIHPSPDTWWIFDKAIKVFKSSLPFSTLQSMQYTVYYKGGHYDWHRDLGDGDAIMKARVNAGVLQLSDPSEYGGGVLQIKTDKEKTTDVMKQKGMVTSFPVDTLHKVTPVTSGIRKTLIMWGLK